MELIEKARRGEVIIGGDVLPADPPEWHCPTCGHEWAADVTSSGPNTVSPHDLSTDEYDKAVAGLTDDELDDFLAALVEIALRAASDADDASPDDGWEAVEDVANRVFEFWTSESDRIWARYAWGALGRAGLTTYRAEVERARVIVRLLALSALYHGFCARAFDKGQPGAWSVDVHDVVGADPRIDPVVLGILAERDGVNAEVEAGHTLEEGSVAAYVIRRLVRSQTDTVSAALLEILRPATLFASLWMSSHEGVRYPLPDDAVNEAVNTDINGEKLNAWQWIDEGMSLD